MGSPERESPPPAEPPARRSVPWRRWLPLAVGGAIGAVAAVFAIGLFVGHWFGVGAPATDSFAWTQVSLPVAEAAARVGLLEEFPRWQEAQVESDAARVALAEAEATLATAPPPERRDPWGMPEPWQGHWCLDTRRYYTHLPELRTEAASRAIRVPVGNGYEEWAEWADSHRADFAIICGAVVTNWQGRVSPEEQTAYASLATVEISTYEVAVTDARAEVASAESHVAQAEREWQTAVDATVAAIVEETRLAQGVRSQQTIRAGLPELNREFCDGAPDEVKARAAAFGLLPRTPSGHLFTYWETLRPMEYIRACEAAYARAQTTVRNAIKDALPDAEWVFCDLNPESIPTAAISLGFLPEDPDDAAVTYWWVIRPDEFVRACMAAFAIR